MDEQNRRKSTSSESELSDGWNLVDAVEVVPVETSDAESVEVINDEQCDSEGYEVETEEKENSSKKSHVAVSPTDSERLVQEELVHLEPVENRSFNLKELLEALVVFVVIAILALSSSYFLLVAEETLWSVTPLIWKAITPSPDRSSIDFDKMKEELNAYQQENLRLANELKKFQEGLTSSDRSNEIAGETSDIYPNFSIEAGQQNEKLVLNDALYESLLSQSSDFDKKTDNRVLFDLKPQLNILSAIETTLLTIQTITKNSPAPEMQRNITQSVNSITEDLEVLNVISSNEKFKNFSEKWFNNMKITIQNIHSDVFNIADKVNRHVSKKITKVHRSFLKKLCHKHLKISPQSEQMELAFSDSKIEEICLKYFATLHNNEDVTFRENKKMQKDILDSTPNKDKEIKKKKYKEKSHEMKSDYEAHESKNLKDDQESLSNRIKRGVEVPADAEGVPAKDTNNLHEAQHKREEKQKQREGNKNSDKFPKNKENKNRDTLGKLDYSKKHKEKGSSKLKDKQLIDNKNDSFEKDSKINEPVSTTNLQNINPTCLSSNYCSKKRNNQPEEVPIKDMKGTKEGNNLYETVSEPGSVLSSKEKSSYNPEELGQSDKDALKKKPRSELRYKSSKMVRRSFEQRSKSNSSSNGSWFSKLGDARANIRNQHQKSEWMFERAKGRDKHREHETKWIFDRAWARQRCRENPKSVWCNWQENFSDSFDSNSYNVFR